jgi:hypothetical protein
MTRRPRPVVLDHEEASLVLSNWGYGEGWSLDLILDRRSIFALRGHDSRILDVLHGALHAPGGRRYRCDRMAAAIHVPARRAGRGRK